MNRKKRSRQEIYCAILDGAIGGNGVCLTRIMQRGNLTTEQAKDHLSYLVARGLIGKRLEKEKSSGCMYKTTPKGIQYLKMASAIVQF